MLEESQIAEIQSAGEGIYSQEEQYIGLMYSKWGLGALYVFPYLILPQAQGMSNAAELFATFLSGFFGIQIGPNPRQITTSQRLITRLDLPT